MFDDIREHYVSILYITIGAAHKKTYDHFTLKFCVLTTRCQSTFENVLGKGENAGIQHFLLFPKRFVSLKRQAHIDRATSYSCSSNDFAYKFKIVSSCV